MKKIMPILAVGILVLSGIGVNAITNEYTILCYDDELDQYQTEMNTAGYIGAIKSFYNFIAQSFIPQKEVLTCIQLLIGRNALTTSPYSLAIREDLTGENLAVVSVNAEDIPVKKNLSDLVWIEFDLDDVALTAGQMYHMVSFTANETDNFYYWGGLWSDPYPNGSVFLSMDGGTNWIGESYIDMCFKTFGLDNLPPDKPEITGPVLIYTPGPHEYTFKAIDPDGDDVSYQIDWRDGDISEWTDWYSSGEEITRSHIYSEKGCFKVRARAKDIHGAIGDWGALRLTFSKSSQQSLNNQNNQNSQSLQQMVKITNR